jgi:ATP-dependent RNA helicase DHX29
MAPNKKKKKAVSNPARGFATISQPSKAKEARITENDVSVEAAASHKSAPTQSEVNVRHQSAEVTKSSTVEPCTIDGMSPEELEAHLENADLQNVIDAHGARCKADATRQVNRLETERRQLRSQSHRLAAASWLSDEVVEDILMRYAKRLDARSTHFLTASTVDIDETSLLLRLWTLEQVLTALKLRDVSTVIEHVVLSSLRGKIEGTQESIWGLQDALKWYATRGSSEDLPDYEHGIISSLTQDSEVVDDEYKNGESVVPLIMTATVGRYTYVHTGCH